MSEIKGKIKVLGEEKTFGSNGFRKTELVITTSDDQYPQDIQVEFVQDKCDLVKNLKVGQEITVAYNLRGREWTSPQGEVKYFNTIQGWRVEAVPLSQAPKQEAQKPKKEPQAELPAEEDHDDLPF